jgi:ABC-type branched-subunit amino acid transport system substrate-binding protein
MVSVYVTAPLCAEASQALESAGSRAGEVRLRIKCLPRAGDLATIGAGARRAVEDASTVAYIGPNDPTAVRFSKPILEAAAIAHIPTSSGATGMARLIHAVEEAGDGSSLRESVIRILKR